MKTIKHVNQIIKAPASHMVGDGFKVQSVLPGGTRSHNNRISRFILMDYGAPAYFPSHSDVQFKIKHLMITTVTGQFGKFDATMQTNGEDFASANISFEADINSITTQNPQRDQHLLAADFFEADKYPKLTFASKEVKKVDDENYKLICFVLRTATL